MMEATNTQCPCFDAESGKHCDKPVTHRVVRKWGRRALNVCRLHVRAYPRGDWYRSEMEPKEVG